MGSGCCRSKKAAPLPALPVVSSPILPFAAVALSGSSPTSSSPPAHRSTYSPRIKRENASLQLESPAPQGKDTLLWDPDSPQKSKDDYLDLFLAPLVGNIDPFAGYIKVAERIHHFPPKNDHPYDLPVESGRVRLKQEPPVIQHPNPNPIVFNNPQELMSGYLEQPLLPLEEALAPLAADIDQLARYIKEAKQKCHRPSKHCLTFDESAAIYIYTMEWSPQSLRRHLDTAFSSNDRDKLQPWFSYLKLLKSAVDKLPNANTEVWQGIHWHEDFTRQLGCSSTPLYSSLGTFTLSPNKIREYMPQHHGQALLLLGLSAPHGKLLTGYTADQYKEVLIWPGLQLSKVKTMEIDGYGSVIIHIQAQYGKHDCRAPPCQDRRQVKLMFLFIG